MNPAKDLMTRDFLQADISSSADSAIKMLAESNNQCIIVTDKTQDNALVGIITERDLIKKLLLSKSKRKIKLDELMTKPVIALSPGDDLLTIQHLMAKQKVKQLPVTEKNYVIGVVEQQHIAQEVYTIEQKNRTFMMYQTIQTLIIVAFLIFVLFVLLIRL
jgi:signal-transduction protein with cAMP-binding, CBS, and nucleotidyltransferase domain